VDSLKGGILLQEQLLLLIELQKTDSIIRAFTVRKSKLPEKIAELDRTLEVFAAAVEEAGKRLEDLTKRQREKESDLKKGQESIKKAQERLTEVKTNKEYQAVLKEIEAVKAKNAVTEDGIISTLEEADRVRGEVKVKEAALGEYRQRYEKERKTVEEELGALDDELLACRRKNDEIRKQTAGDLLKRYETIQAIRNGLAVVEVWKEVCKGCNMNIPPQLYNELQTARDLISCPNCNRIIYRGTGEDNG
jgi:uncharacterized protein